MELKLPDNPESESDMVIISGSTEDGGRIDIGFWPLPIASCNLSRRLWLFSSEPKPLSTKSKKPRESKNWVICRQQRDNQLRIVWEH